MQTNSDNPLGPLGVLAVEAARTEEAAAIDALTSGTPILQGQFGGPALPIIMNVPPGAFHQKEAPKKLLVNLLPFWIDVKTSWHPPIYQLFPPSLSDLPI